MRMDRVCAVAFCLFERFEKRGTVDRSVDPADGLMIGMEKIETFAEG